MVTRHTSTVACNQPEKRHYETVALWHFADKWSSVEVTVTGHSDLPPASVKWTAGYWFKYFYLHYTAASSLGFVLGGMPNTACSAALKWQQQNRKNSAFIFWFWFGKLIELIKFGEYIRKHIFESISITAGIILFKKYVAIWWLQTFFFYSLTL